MKTPLISMSLLSLCFKCTCSIYVALVHLFCWLRQHQSVTLIGSWVVPVTVATINVIGLVFKSAWTRNWNSKVSKNFSVNFWNCHSKLQVSVPERRRKSNVAAHSRILDSLFKDMIDSIFECLRFIHFLNICANLDIAHKVLRVTDFLIWMYAQIMSDESLRYWRWSVLSEVSRWSFKIQGCKWKRIVGICSYISHAHYRHYGVATISWLLKSQGLFFKSL